MRPGVIGSSIRKQKEKRKKANTKPCWNEAGKRCHFVNRPYKKTIPDKNVIKL